MKKIKNNKKQYQHFCETYQSVPVFAQPWYLDAVCEGNGDSWDVKIVEKGDKVVGVWPYDQKRKGPFQVCTMPHLTKFLGLYFHAEFQHPKQAHKITQALIEQMPDCAYLSQNFYYHYTDWLPFYWQGFQQSTAYSYVLDLKDLDQVQAGFSADYRNQKIRKAEAVVRLTEERSPEDFYQVVQKSFARQQLAFPFSLAYFLKYDAAMIKHQARRILFAVDEQERIHSVVYLLIDQDRVYYHMAGDDPALRNSGAGVWLAWQAMQLAQRDLQKDIFDFEGSMIPAIERVRRQFGAQQIPYFRIWKYRSRWYKLLHQLRG